MKILITKNIRYKQQSYSIGEEVAIENSDLEEFMAAEVVGKVIYSGEEENEVAEDDIKANGDIVNANAYEDMTKAEISEILTLNGIEHNLKDKKEELINLLSESNIGADEIC